MVYVTDYESIAQFVVSGVYDRFVQYVQFTCFSEENHLGELVSVRVRYVSVCVGVRVRVGGRVRDRGRARIRIRRGL